MPEPSTEQINIEEEKTDSTNNEDGSCPRCTELQPWCTTLVFRSRPSTPTDVCYETDNEEISRVDCDKELNEEDSIQCDLRISPEGVPEAFCTKPSPGN